MVGVTPNIDRIAKEGAIFMTAYAEQSCTAGRTSFFTGMNPLRAGMIMPQLPGSTSFAAARHTGGCQVSARSRIQHRGIRQEPSRRQDKLASDGAWLSGVLGLPLSLGCDAGRELSDINKSPTEQTVVPPCKNTPVKGLTEVPGAIDPKDGLCMTPPRPVLACTSSDGTEANQVCKDEGPLTLERSKTVDEEISAKVVDYLDRNDPKKTNKPFFVWYNPARMHITTMFSPKYKAMLGVKGGKDWGINEVGMKQTRRQHRHRAEEARGHGRTRYTLVVFTTDNGAEVITYPDGGVTPFRGGKLTTWEGGMRVPMMSRWPGHIKPGTTNDQIFSMLDWLPTLVDIAGGPKGDGLKTEIEAGKYAGILKTTLDGFDQRAYLEGQDGDIRARYLFYYSGTHPSAVRYKNWKFYYAMAGSNATGGPMGVQTLSLDTGRQHQAGSVRNCRGSRSVDLAGDGRRTGRAEHGLYLRLEPPAHRPVVLAEGTEPTSNSRRCRLRRATILIRLLRKCRSRPPATRLGM